MYFMEIYEECLNYGAPYLHKNIYLSTPFLMYEMKCVMYVEGTEVECRERILMLIEYFTNIY